jgi:hypothetical protein
VAAEFAGLHLTVEFDAGGWNVCVRDRGDGRTLYRAQRCNLSAGKIAAAEFAGAAAWGSPEMIARALEWKVYW